jgi:class 3 adenylate cyclase/tetratricopeptide (TPR) repeat protein
VCRSCGEVNPERARYCLACGQPLPATTSSVTGESRKIVTVIFCDVVGSTPLGEQLDPESLRRVMTRFFERTSQAVERHGGTVAKYIGDAVMAVFGIPTLHEDDAIRAVRAAAEMRAAVAALNVDLLRDVGLELRVRIGVNTGPAVVGDPSLGDALVVGDVVNVAARLEQVAAPDEIVLGADTYALVRAFVTVDAGTALTLKGKAEPVRGFRLDDVDLDPGRQDRLRPAFVGRDLELAAMGSAFERSVRERSCVLLSVLGVAGIGKSRLVDEFRAARADDARIVSGRCLPYGDGITFWPVAEVVKDACAITDDDARDDALTKIRRAVDPAPEADLVAETVAAVIGVAATKASMQESFWAVRRFFETLAAERPLVVVFDDVHWAEPTFLDLVEYLAGHARDASILLLCVARPELLDMRPGWTAITGDEEVVHLSSLTADEGAQLMGHLVGSDAMPPAHVERLVDAAGGNPLFLEEMFRMLEDEGVIERAGDRWRLVGDVGTVAVPPTIHALLGARIDRLDPTERAVLGTASVMGKEFWWGAVSDLAPPAVQPAVGRSLGTLVRKGLIVPARSTLVGEDAFGFHHGLIQDATYRALPKERRAELHEGFADWIERRARDRDVEYEEVIGYHLEQAFRYREELGGGAGAGDLRMRGAARLTSAGRRALARGDMPGAVSLLERASRLVGDDPSLRASLLPDLGEALMESGELGRADGVLAEAVAAADEIGDRGLRGHAMLVRLLLLESTDPKMRSEIAVQELAWLIPTFEEAGDELGLARAWRVKGDVSWTGARYADADEALSRAIEHARRAGAGWEEAELLGQYMGSGVYGPAHADEVLERCERARAQAAGNRLVEARALRSIAAIHAMQGRIDGALDEAEAAAAILEDLGMWLRAAFVSETIAFVHRLAGDTRASEHALRSGYDVIDKLGEQGFLSTVSALLAHRILDQRRGDEAASFIAASEAAAADDDLTTQTLLESARGRALALAGDVDEAVARCGLAVEIAERTDDLNMHGDVLADLADVLTAAGDRARAGEALERAEALFVTKGNVVQAEAVRDRRSAAD